MDSNLFAPRSDPPALNQWRHSLLNLFLRLSLVMALPVVIASVISDAWAGLTMVTPLAVGAYLLVALISLLPQLSFQLRAYALVCVGYAAGVTLLLQNGIVGSGSLLLLLTLILATLLLPWQRAAALALLISASVAIIFGGIGAGQIIVINDFSSRLADPGLMLSTALFVIYIVWFLLTVLLSLIGRLGESLRATAATNAELERRVAERTAELRAALRENGYLATAMNNATAGMLITTTTPAGEQVIFANPAFSTITGYPVAEVLGKLCHFLHGPETDTDELRALQQAIVERRPMTSILRSYRKDGAPFWNEITISVMRDESGAHAGFVGLMLDVTERVDADMHRRMLERRLQLILRTIPEHLWLKDSDGRYLLVSEALAAFYGYRPQDMIGRTVDALYSAERAAAINAADRQAREGNAHYSERLIANAAGQARWFGSQRAPVYDEDGSLVGLIGLARDITSRKEAELALARQLRYAEALAHCSRILIDQSSGEGGYGDTLAQALEILRVAVDSDRVAVYYYPDWMEGLARASTRMRLISAVNAPGLPPQRPPTPEELRDIPDELSARLVRGESFNGRAAGRFPNHPLFERYQAANGVRSTVFQPILVGERWWGHISVNDHGADRVWDDGAVQLLRTAAEMIVTFSEGWQSRQALASSEAGLRALRDALPDLLFVVDDDGVILRYHAPSPEQLYTPPDAFLGLSLGQVLPAEAAEVILAGMAETRRSGRMQIVEYELTLHGETRIYEDRLVPIDDAEILSVVRDISEARRAADAMRLAKEAAESADRAKSAFLATMSHEIRTPLNAVIGMAGLLRETSLSAEQRSYVEMINSGGATLLEVITHILDFSRIESGYLGLEAQPFDLRACIDEASGLVALEAERKGLALIRQIAPDIPVSIVGDVVRLRQVMINLLANAVKFTDRGSVTIGAAARPLSADRCEVTLTVRDTGIGIAHAQVGQIFEPFVQADSATTRRYGGTGLGLTISRQLVELMGGRISVESTPGAGSAFTVTLPFLLAGPGERPRPPAPPQDRPAGLPLCVLVAEDNPINQLVTARLLARLGHEADIVENGLVAVERVRGRRYDVVLMDVEMPEMDGFEASLRIRELGDAVAQPYIIALTAHIVNGDRDRYLRAGMNDHLSKPLHLDELRRALASAPSPPALPPPSDPPAINPTVDQLRAPA